MATRQITARGASRNISEKNRTEITTQRGGAFNAITEFYQYERDRTDDVSCDWLAIRYIWGWCYVAISHATRDGLYHGKRIDEVDFYFCLFDYVKSRGGKFKRIGGSVYASARFPHKELHRGAIIPRAPDIRSLPNDERLNQALKALGVA